MQICTQQMLRYIVQISAKDEYGPKAVDDKDG